MTAAKNITETRLDPPQSPAVYYQLKPTKEKKMKKLLCICLAIAVLVTIACQRREAPVNEMGVTVRLLTDASGVDDKSFNASAWRGILTFYGDTWDNPRQRGFAYDWITAQTQDMFIPNLRRRLTKVTI